MFYLHSFWSLSHNPDFFEADSGFAVEEPKNSSIHILVFIYKHLDGKINKGSFFDKHFANYQSEKNSYIAHYYIKSRNLKKAVYTRNTAKFYNRGHVYEWYIEDLNKGKIEENSNISPIDFMN